VNGRSQLFSVVIPTRNRANLLPHALQSVLHQKFDDYEIVVSDNCSSDNTEQVVRHLVTGRVSQQNYSV
jgi:glycosyltransferase involved in cell wall biosynthesis